jgi:hypothetical protein
MRAAALVGRRRGVDNIRIQACPTADAITAQAYLDGAEKNSASWADRHMCRIDTDYEWK